MTWGARRLDDGELVRRFDSEREGRDWINERVMPWNFGLIDLDAPTNLTDAIEIVAEIQKLRAVQTELRSAFARRELDGGVRAAFDHPLYLEATRALEALHERLTLLI